MSKNNDKENLFKSHLQAQNKLDYVTGKKKPKVDCILCEIINKSDKVEQLTIYENELTLVCLNLYPYNPGHLMVIPKRHIKDFRELTDEEILDISHTIMESENLLEEVYSPTGFNVGLNLGEFSGASISHIHYHVVPRYPRELGYIDIIGGARVVVEGVSKVYEKLKNRAPDFYH